MTDLTSLKQRLHPALVQLAEGGPDELEERLSAIYAPDAQWRGSHPMNAATGIGGIASTLWLPLFRAFPDLERRDLIFVAGRSVHAPERPVRVAATGHLCGTWREPWLGIPPTGRVAVLRYGEVHEIDGQGRIARSTLILDVLDAMRQADHWPLQTSPAPETTWLGPINGDGLRLDRAEEEEGEASIRQTLAMHGTLAAFDDKSVQGDPVRQREALRAMPQREHWHERMMWYGPAGVGTTRGLAGFVDQHQAPFRVSFPGRRGGGTLLEEGDAEGGGHYLQIGDGPYSVTGGWPSVRAMHDGGEWLGMAPTGRPIGMRVMDFYLHHEGLIRENWVPIDVLDILRQMGFDAMGWLARRTARP